MLLFEGTRQPVSGHGGQDQQTAFIDAVKANLRSVRVLGFTAVIGISCTIMGPFGTFARMNLLERGLYWILLVFAYMAAGMVIREAVRRTWPEMAQVRRVPIEALAVGLACMPLTVAWSFVIDGPGYQPRLSPLELVAVAALAYVLVELIHSLPQDGVPKDGAEARPAPRILDRLDGASNAPIVHLTVDDHYVEVSQADGTRHRLLMRFGDAVTEMDGVDGFCVHRSHWVSKAAISETYRERGRDFLRLRTGVVVPVSRTYRPNLVTAGFLADD